MNTETATLLPHGTMQELLAAYPGAQRALFRKYHIGGCSQCAFQPTETLAQVCARNGNLDPGEVLAHLQSAHAEDARVLISPEELARLQQTNPGTKLVDVRSREEFEAVHLAGARLLSQPLMQEVLGQWPRDTLFVLYDHQGRQSLDAAAYFAGHGFTRVRCLQGGIDAWSQQIDGTIRRYRVG